MNFESNHFENTRDTENYESVLYVRVSDKKQIDGGSGLGSQETRGREYSKYLKIPVAKVFSDRAVSGKLLDRPGMQDLLNFLKKRKPDVRYIVIIDDISRLARDVRVFFDLRDAIHATGALLESPTVKFKENRDADGNFYEGIQALGAQHYREKVAETTKNRSWARLMGGYWVFHAPIGYKYIRSKTEGGLLVRDEPVASIVTEALEGYASGRFAIQAEVQRWLEKQPEFLRRKPNGKIRPQVVSEMLNQPLFAGYLESKIWNVPFRKARHEPLISLETFERIKTRRQSAALAPARKDIRLDFPLRGFVTCGDCNNPLTSCWSKSGTGKRHPYYLCHKKSCSSYGKSIQRDKLETDFNTLLKTMRPRATLTRLVEAMVEQAWGQQEARIEDIRKSLQKQVKLIETQIDGAMDRIVETTSDITSRAFERKIEKLEKERLLTEDQLSQTGKKTATPHRILELALKFLSNPYKLWETGNLSLQKLTLRLAFSDTLAYCRFEGFRTPKTTLPFSMLGGSHTSKCKMVPGGGFEPPTRGFSIRCSTPELPGHLTNSCQTASLFIRAGGFIGRETNIV